MQTLFRFIERLKTPTPVNLPIAQGDRVDEALNKLQGQLLEFSSAPPTFVPSGKTYKVKADTQVLFTEEIDLDGDLDLDGVLVEVN